ncbi:MAG: ChbG/HpnK family deacetylase [Rhodoferax sp.]|nr:ChbG/HpnK family deacetylase [Rhodoferax sp.]
MSSAGPPEAAKAPLGGSEPRAAGSVGVIVCADDFAGDAVVSDGILRLARQGRISATSAMTLSPRWPQDAAPLRELRGRIDVGLHLDWTSEFARAAGHGLPLGAAMLRALLGGFEPQRAAGVIERQLDAFESGWQAPPDHVDGHQHVQQFAGIREALLRVLQRRYGGSPPYLRVSRPPPGRAALKERLIAALGADALEKIAESAGVARAGALLGIYDFQGDEAAYADRMAAWLGQLRAWPVAVLMCHPASGLAPGDAIAPARLREFQYLSGPLWPQALAACGVHLARGSALKPAG